MRRLVSALLSALAFSCHPVPAGAAEPPRVSALRESFLVDAAAQGMDPARCKLTHEAADGDDYVVVECAELPVVCLLILHPTEETVAVVRCVPNPAYEDPEVDKMQKL